MPVLVLGQRDVARLLPMRDCIEAMSQAMTLHAEGKVVQPVRQVVPLPGRRAALAMMPAAAGADPGLGVKVIAVFPGNRGTPWDSHQGAVLLFDPEHGTLEAIVDASEVTAIRTAAVSALATRVLAREDAGDLAMLGAGVQARTHLEAMLAVRTIRRVRVWSHTQERRDRFAAHEGRRHGVPVESVASVQSAVSGADLICTVTSAREPILRGKWIAPGAHVNAVGACVRTQRELDTDAVKGAGLFVDDRRAALHEAGDLLIPMAEGAFGEEHIAGELGEVLTGRTRGREHDRQVTVFESLGLAVQDLAAAHLVYTRAVERGLGTSVELGGERPDET
jgi:ornithine cyclodeaminase